MTRLSVFVLLIGILACICSVSPAAAATAPQAAATTPQAAPVQPVLTPDPFLAQATVTTSVVEAVRCPCQISSGCPYAGFDCADPAGCCHCAGPSPSLLKCVYNAQ